MLAGYHYEPKSVIAKKYHKKFMLRVGGWYLFSIACLNVCVMCGIYEKYIVCYVFIGLTLLSIIGGIIYFNKSKKMKTLQELERENDEKAEEK